MYATAQEDVILDPLTDSISSNARIQCMKLQVALPLFCRNAPRFTCLAERILRPTLYSVRHCCHKQKETSKSESGQSIEQKGETGTQSTLASKLEQTDEPNVRARKVSEQKKISNACEHRRGSVVEWARFIEKLANKGLGRMFIARNSQMAHESDKSGLLGVAFIFGFLLALFTTYIIS